MLKKISLKTIKTRTVRNKFNIIISLIIFILLFGVVNFWFGTKVLSGIRAYVGGEGLWSKAQKEAVNNLVKYANSGDQTDYDAYLRYTKVQMGDKQARLELDKPHPDLAVIQQGFVQGGNNPADVNDLTFLYRRFRHVSYMSSAIQTWTQGDQEITELLNVGDQIHGLVSSPSPKTQLAQNSRRVELAALVDQTYQIDGQLTVLENQFSATLGNGSRVIANELTQFTIIITVVLGSLALVTAILIARALIKLDKLKTEFVSMASHQLRTPLTTINWYSEALLSESEGKLNDNQKNFLRELRGGGQRMANLISDLLNVSSLDLGTYVSDVKDVDINQTLKTVIKDQQMAIDKKNISLTTTLDPQLPSLKLDEQLLIAVFQNLISNSIKYVNDGGKIDVAVQNQKKQVLIKVSDNGIGIPKKQQSQIFTKLFRADNADSLDTKGNGLGLYIVKAMVNRIGGKIWFDSSESHGTNFYVKIPLHGRSKTKSVSR